MLGLDMMMRNFWGSSAEAVQLSEIVSFLYQVWPVTGLEMTMAAADQSASACGATRGAPPQHIPRRRREDRLRRTRMSSPHVQLNLPM